MYADDVTLVVSGESTQIINDKLNRCMAKMNNWLLENKLILNAEKTKVMQGALTPPWVMLLGSHQRIRSFADPILRVLVAGQPLEWVQLFKYLGVTLDRHLTFKKHIENVSLIILQKLGIVRRLRNVLSKNQLTQIYWGYVLPHILYCCNTWSKRSRQSIDVLGRLHKRAAYIISRRSWETPSHQVFNELKWPTLNELLDRVMACMVFKCTHSISTLNVQNGFIFLDDIAQRNTRSNNKKLLSKVLSL